MRYRAIIEKYMEANGFEFKINEKNGGYHFCMNTDADKDAKNWCIIEVGKSTILSLRIGSVRKAEQLEKVWDTIKENWEEIHFMTNAYPGSQDASYLMAIVCGIGSRWKANMDKAILDILDASGAITNEMIDDKEADVMFDDSDVFGEECLLVENSTAANDGWKSGSGSGFADVAGMDDLKARIRREVIWPVTHKSEMERYHIAAPNGMLLYGAPGCGKTYFAERLAQEAGVNFKVFYPSTLGSIYLHGTQGKIAEMFNEARKHAPCIICLDEIDAMIPVRSSGPNSENINGEVNEFLAQLNNCGKDGIFVIGTTNRRALIDPAALRKGRFDIQVEIPMPDHAQRKALFELHLKDRPVSDDIDTDILARRSESMVSADVAYIVNDAALDAAISGCPITMDRLLASIAKSQSKAKADRRIGFATAK